MSLVSISAYKPLPGFASGFEEVLKLHIPTLLEEGLITDQPPFRMRAVDGTIIEIFEWVSEEAKEEAHSHPRIMELWSRFHEYSEMIKLMDIMECHEHMATFLGLNLEKF